MEPSIAIAHALPGRVRFRLPPRARTERVAEAVSALGGVTECTWSPRTRGLLVRYEPDATTSSTIAEHVAAHVGASVGDAAHAGNGVAATPPLRLAVPALFAEANGRLTRATRGAIDLASGIPLALVAWAAFELLRGRAGPLAWSTALWYAHGLFRDYNLPSSDG